MDHTTAPAAPAWINIKGYDSMIWLTPALDFGILNNSSNSFF